MILNQLLAFTNQLLSYWIWSKFTFVSCLHNRLVNGHIFPLAFKNLMQKHKGQKFKTVVGTIRLWGNNHRKKTKDLHSPSYMITPSMSSFPSLMQFWTKVTWHNFQIQKPHDPLSRKWCQLPSRRTFKAKLFDQSLLPKSLTSFELELHSHQFFLFNRRHVAPMIQEDMICIKLFTWGKFSA